MAWQDFCFFLFCFVYDFKSQSNKFLCLDKTFAPCSFAWFKAIKFETGIFLGLIKMLFLVLLHRLWLQKSTMEVFMAGKDLCFLFLFMVLIPNEG